ncbi:MAG: hypothetical protein LBJ84_01190, partial [Oscillospiraceae bacterium]|nr:hypothetical protein [Oscillospiraceae bacterium]
MRTSFAAMRIETVIFAIALSALFISLVGCGGANSETDPIGGVSLQTELDAYASDTQRILVYWSNNSDQSLTFGESWHLEKYNDSGGWESVASDKDAAFHDIGYLLEPGAVRKHVYWVKYIYDPLDEGLYRIATYYFDDSVFPVTPSDHRALYAEFTVSNDAAGLKKSELDYDDLDNSKDLTPHEMQQATSIRVYKNKKTYDTTLVIDGEKYAIAQGDGPWGVIQINWHEIDGREYLIYAYSREQNEKVARAAVFDIEAR